MKKGNTKPLFKQTNLKESKSQGNTRYSEKPTKKSQQGIQPLSRVDTDDNPYDQKTSNAGIGAKSHASGTPQLDVMKIDDSELNIKPNLKKREGMQTALDHQSMTDTLVGEVYGSQEMLNGGVKNFNFESRTNASIDYNGKSIDPRTSQDHLIINEEPSHSHSDLGKNKRNNDISVLQSQDVSNIGGQNETDFLHLINPLEQGDDPDNSDFDDDQNNQNKQIKELIRKQKKNIHIRKNQFDNTAGLVYGLNVSLVHFTLFMMLIIIVRTPDIAKAEQFDKDFGDITVKADPSFQDITCTSYSQGLQKWYIIMTGVHVICVFINLFREIYETQLGSLGRIMRFVEVIGIGSYGVFTIQALWYISVVDYWNHFLKDHPLDFEKVRPCFIDREKLFEMTGTTIAFAKIEVLVYFTFTMTIVFLVARSRCQKSGIDNSEQFEDVYMSYLVNKIIQCMVFRGKKLNKKFKPQSWIDKQRTVDVEAISLKVKLTATDFYKIKSKLEEKEKHHFVEADEAIKWIERCIVGNITKEQLDKQRQKECNSLDIMQNTNFVYHPESLIEMQIMCLCAIQFYVNRNNLDDIKLSDSSNLIMLCLLIEHVFSGICAIFRSYDIDKNGQIDINGVKRASTELFIGNIQFFIACIIIGFTINHFMQEEQRTTFHNQEYVLQNYWIVIDMIILFLAQSYISISLYMKVSGEIDKNLYTLFFLQKNILQQQAIVDNVVKSSLANEILIMSVAKQNKTERSDIRKSLDEFKNMNAGQKRSFQANTGDKMNKIIEEYTNIQKNLKELTRNFNVTKKNNVPGSPKSQQRKRERNNQPKKQMRQVEEKQQTTITQQESSSDDDSRKSTDGSATSEDEAVPIQELEKWKKVEDQVLKSNNTLLKNQIAKAKEQIIIIEDDYLYQEVLKIQDDVYNLTIAANMTKFCSPVSLIFCLRQCIMVFLLQIMIAVLFSYEYVDFERFQPFGIYKTFLRILVPILMTMKFSKELYNATKMLTFLKRMKGSANHVRGRFINIMLASMQIIAPTITVVSLVVNITQQSALSQITKAYVTLMFVVNIDDMFSPSLPSEVRTNAKILNEQNSLKITSDCNSYSLICGRMKLIIKSRLGYEDKETLDFKKVQLRRPGLFYEFSNILVNIWYSVITNFQIVFFNYFIGFLCVFFQIAGFYFNMYDWK